MKSSHAAEDSPGAHRGDFITKPSARAAKCLYKLIRLLVNRLADKETARKIKYSLKVLIFKLNLIKRRGGVTAQENATKVCSTSTRL